MNRELLKLKKVLLQVNAPSREDKLCEIFGILDGEGEFEEVFDKFQYELSDFIENKRSYK